MGETVRIAVEDISQTAEARRIARRMAREIGLDPNASERVAISITEICTNILKHADRGQVLVSLEKDSAALEVVALDKGPGMSDVAKCLRDGFSTGGSPGQGLGAIIRLSGSSDFYSAAGRGTAVLARWSAPRRVPDGHIQVGAVNVPKPGESVCGDAWGVAEQGDETIVLVADGLGHGPAAREASIEAVRMLHANPDLPPVALLERSHRALRSSRGAAVAVARIDRARGKVAYAGVGNISGQIYHGSKIGERMVSVSGTAGFETQHLREFGYSWPADGMLVMHSDGLSSSTSAEDLPGLALHDPSLIAGVLFRDFARGNDDATVVVAKAA